MLVSYCYRRRRTRRRMLLAALALGFSVWTWAGNCGDGISGSALFCLIVRQFTPLTSPGSGGREEGPTEYGVRTLTTAVVEGFRVSEMHFLGFVSEPA